MATSPGVVPEAQARTHIPGCVRSITLTPEPRWPVALRNTRALHGALTRLISRPHGTTEPNFMLLPWRGGTGWAAQWVVPGGETLPTRNEVEVFNGRRCLALGPPIRLKRPAMPPPGNYLMSLDTITPVFIRQNARHSSQGCALEADTLLSSLRLSLPISRALGCEVDASALRLSVEVQEVRPAAVYVGGRWGSKGMLVGWEGRVLLHCNAYTRHLLELAALVGLGGRTSLGFGRVCVREARP